MGRDNEPSTDAGGTPPSRMARALAIDPLAPTTVYAGTDAGVFGIEQVAARIGDCHVNTALGNADASACALGIPSGAAVDVALIIQAVNSALTGCA